MSKSNLDISISKKLLKKNTAKTENAFEEMFEDVLKDFASDSEDRSKRVHSYKNRTGFLTKSTDSKYFESKNGQSISVFNSAKYASYVESNTNNKWIQSAMRYYKRSFEKDLDKVPKVLK